MKKSKVLLFWAMTLLLVVIVFLNLKVFFERRWESSYVPEDYATLYYLEDIPTIRHWEILDRHNVRLEIKWNREVDQWRVRNVERGHVEVQETSFPVLRLEQEKDRQFHTFALTPVPDDPGPDIIARIRLTPGEHYKKGGRSQGDSYTVRANVPCGDFDQYALSDWIDNYEYLDENTLKQADQLIHSKSGIRESDPTRTKIEKLFHVLKPALEGGRGVPADDSRWTTPWDLFQGMCRGERKGWCTQHALIYVFFANRAGIPTRFVFTARTQSNSVVYTGHAFAESYITEQNRWAWVDMDFGLASVTNKKGQVLNTAELMHLNQHDAFDSCQARVYIGSRWQDLPGVTTQDTVMTFPFPMVSGVAERQFISQAILKYRRPPNVEDVRGDYRGFLHNGTFLWGNLERYLFKPQLAYSFYPTPGTATYRVRRILFILFFIVLLIWIPLLIRQIQRGRTWF
jgi:hypothetical protein